MGVLDSDDEEKCRDNNAVRSSVEVTLLVDSERDATEGVKCWTRWRGWAFRFKWEGRRDWGSEFVWLARLPDAGGLAE